MPQLAGCTATCTTQRLPRLSYVYDDSHREAHTGCSRGGFERWATPRTRLERFAGHGEARGEVAAGLGQQHTTCTRMLAGQVLAPGSGFSEPRRLPCCIFAIQLSLDSGRIRIPQVYEIYRRADTWVHTLLDIPSRRFGQTRYWTNKVRLSSRCNFSLLVLGGTTVHVCSMHMYYWTEYYQFCTEAVSSSGGNSAFVSVLAHADAKRPRRTDIELLGDLKVLGSAPSLFCMMASDSNTFSGWK
ncbi:hypothetical protein B0H14DRAFT_415999 [Mycena olivaceomarginata]|nr:hypothetical protein B0H14DRAFT_415999 [Mycena olivaceomarginata]